MTAWCYPGSPDARLPLPQALARFPRETDLPRGAARIAGALALRAWLATYFRLRIRGRENLPADGSYVLAANHASHLDALCLLAALPLGRLHRAYPAAAADYFFNTRLAGALAGLFLNALPFPRKGNPRQALDVCRRLLQDRSAGGNVLILFPEGTRSATGRIGPFKAGIGQLVAASDVPVVPCHLAGAFAAWPRGRALPAPRKLTLTIGRPLTFGALDRSRDAYDAVAARVEAAVRRLAACHATLPGGAAAHDPAVAGTPALCAAG